MNGYIKRSDVLEAFHNLKPSGFENSVAGMAAIKTVEKIPDADVELVKHGHWLDVDRDEYVHLDEDGFTTYLCYCSVCGYGSEEYRAKGNYCPNCGAKMDEVET